jgi:hypothetical protein
MDTSQLMGAPEKNEQPAFEYTAQAASPYVTGEVTLKIGENALSVSALFASAEISFAEISELALSDYVVTVRSDGGDYAFSRMGNWCQPFYDALCESYSAAVLRALFVSGEPIVTAACAEGPVRVFDNCVVTLPPSLGARRVPLCFVTGMEKRDYAVTLRTDTGESVAYIKLGYDYEPFAAALETQIRALRERTLAAVRELDTSLSASQASQLASLMPEGAAASVARLTAIAPSFLTALERKINDTRAADSYNAFRRLCDIAQIHIGFRKSDVPETGDVLSDLEAPPDPYLLWITAPSPDGQFAAVEFCEPDSATFVYRTGGDFAAFARQLTRALEAVSFKREVIRLSDDELQNPENADYYMASRRTAALRFVRNSFVGRVIHASAESWKRKLLELWGV